MFAYYRQGDCLQVASRVKLEVSRFWPLESGVVRLQSKNTEISWSFMHSSGCIVMHKATMVRTQWAVCCYRKYTELMHLCTVWWFNDNYRNTMSKSRVVAKKILSVEQSEGVGARVRRSVGRPEVFNDSLSCKFIVLYSFVNSIHSYYWMSLRSRNQLGFQIIPTEDLRLSHTWLMVHFSMKIFVDTREQ